MGHLDRQLGREHGHRDSPNRLGGRALADEVQEATGHDRREGERGQDLGAMINQPHQPPGPCVGRVPGRSAHARR